MAAVLSGASSSSATDLMSGEPPRAHGRSWLVRYRHTQATIVSHSNRRRTCAHLTEYAILAPSLRAFPKIASLGAGRVRLRHRRHSPLVIPNPKPGRLEDRFALGCHGRLNRRCNRLAICQDLSCDQIENEMWAGWLEPGPCLISAGSNQLSYRPSGRCAAGIVDFRLPISMEFVRRVRAASVTLKSAIAI